MHDEVNKNDVEKFELGPDIDVATNKNRIREKLISQVQHEQLILSSKFQHCKEDSNCNMSNNFT